MPPTIINLGLAGATDEREAQRIEPPTGGNGPNPIERDLVTLFDQYLTDARKRRKEWESEHLQHLEMSNGKTMRTNVSGNDVHIHAIRRAVSTILKHAREGLFPSDDWFEYTPTTEADKPAAEAMTRLVSHQLRRQNFVDNMTDNALFDWISFGTCVVKVTWDLKIAMRTTREVTFEPTMGEMGFPVGVTERIQHSEIPVQVHSWPKIETVDLLSFFPSHPDVEDPENLDYTVETSAITHEEILANERREETIISNGIPVTRTVGLYRNVDELERAKQQRTSRRGDGDEDETISSSVSGGDDLTLEAFPRKEIWIKLDIPNLLRTLQPDGKTPKYTDEQKDEFLFKWDLMSRPLKAGRWFVAETAGDTLIRLEHNPRPINKNPYLKCQFKRRRNSFYGDGLYGIAKGLQMTLDAVLSNTLDALGRITNPKYVVNEQLVDDQHGSAEEQFTDPTTNVIHGRHGARPNDIAAPFHPPENIVPAGFTGVGQIFELMERTTGATAELRGSTSGGRRTASEINVVTSGALAEITLENRRFESQIVEAALDDIWPLNQQFLTLPEAIQVLDDEGQFAPLQVSPEEIRGSGMSAYAKGSVELVDRQRLGQVLTNIFAIFAPHQVMRIPAVARRVLKTLRIPGKPSEYILSDEEYRQMITQQMAMAMGQAPQGQGPGQIPLITNDQQLETAQTNV